MGLIFLAFSSPHSLSVLAGVFSKRRRTAQSLQPHSSRALSSCWGGICLYSEFFFPIEDTNTVNTLKRDRWSLQRNANIMYIGQNSGVVLELIGLVRYWKVLYTSHNTNRTYNTENDTNWAVKQFDSFIICIYYTCSFYELILYN